MSSLRDVDYLQHILQAIDKIQRSVGTMDKTGFFQDEVLQDAVIRNIEIIGEAANRLSPEFTVEYKDIPWRDIAGMRHRLIHAYFQVNMHTVWKVVGRDLPVLKSQVKSILEGLG
ncbi:MAG: DUF86 domain-containing protein [Nitrospirales bacterium]|nr:DUF86 domain-containing protein [Nitrospirales bacterium]